MPVAVTGGTGFLGRPTVGALAGLGARVRVASRAPRRRPDQPGWIHLDIADRSTWKNLLDPEPPERLVHLAWSHLDDFNDTRHYLDLFPLHAEFLLWCGRSGIGDITVAGTCLEYGLQEGRLAESAPAEPVTAYAIAKDSLRRALEHAGRTLPLSLKWARIFYVRGDDEQEKGVFELIRKAAAAGRTHVDLTGGEQLRDYLPRSEIGRFLARFCLQDRIRGIVNCCSGTPVSMRGMVEEYARRWPHLRLEFGRVPYRSYEPPALWGDRERMDAVLAAPPAADIPAAGSSRAPAEHRQGVLYES